MQAAFEEGLLVVAAHSVRTQQRKGAFQLLELFTRQRICRKLGPPRHDQAQSSIFAICSPVILFAAMRSVLAEFSGFPVFADLAVADGRLLAQLRILQDSRLVVVECAEQELALLVAVMHASEARFS